MANALKKTILGVVGSSVATSSRVTDIRQLSEHFRLVDLEIDPARLVHLGPIDKIKINTGDWNVRTYTPVLQPHALGRLRLLIYLHGQAAGARWAGALREGDSVQTIGPKAALQVDHAPFVLVGDETSFAIALNFQSRPDVHSVFEVTHASEAKQVLAALGLRNTTVVPRAQSQAHRADLHAEIQHRLQALESPRVILTGYAQTIQYVGRALKSSKARPDLQTKPHWADHKEGLD